MRVRNHVIVVDMDHSGSSHDYRNLRGDSFTVGLSWVSSSHPASSSSIRDAEQLD